MIIDIGVLNVSTTYEGSVTFMDETAGFKNAFGLYKINDQGDFYDVTVVFENSSAQGSGGQLIRGSSSFETTFSENDKIGFFVAPNAAQNDRRNLLENGGTNYVLRDAAGDIANLDDTGPISLFHISESGVETKIWAQYSSRTWHSSADEENSFALNGDGTDHTIWDLQIDDGNLVLDMSFEDLWAGGDKDYTDIVFRLDVGPENTLDVIDSSHDPSSSLAAADRLGVSQGDVVTFSPLANDPGVDLTLTHLNGQAVSVGDVITLEDGETISLLEDGFLQVNGSNTPSDFDKLVTYSVVDQTGAVDESVIAIVTASQPSDDDVVITARGEATIDLLTSVDAGDATSATVTRIAGQDAVIDQTYQLASGSSVTYQGNGILSARGADITADEIDELSYVVVTNSGVTFSKTLPITTSPVDGTDGDDNLVQKGQSDPKGNTIDGGDGAAEVIMGYGGQDSIRSGLGDDAVYAGDDDDTVNGEQGDDQIYGNHGRDILIGSSGDDQVCGNEGNDEIYGGAGPDWTDNGLISVYDTSGNRFDQYGNPLPADDDMLCGGLGDDHMSGSAGHDVLHGNAGDDTLSGGSGDDTLYGGVGDDDISGGAQDDLLYGEGGHDTLHGGSGDNTLYGGEGNDIMTSGAGDDYHDGGHGDDEIYGGNGDDILHGGSGEDAMRGGSGNDQLLGGAGFDTLDAGSGNDVLEGGEGNDRLKAGSGDDSLSGGSGDDYLAGWKGDDILEGGEGNDQIYLGAGDDTASGGAGSDRFVFRFDDLDGGHDTILDFRNSGSERDRLDLRSCNFLQGEVEADLWLRQALTQRNDNSIEVDLGGDATLTLIDAYNAGDQFYAQVWEGIQLA